MAEELFARAYVNVKRKGKAHRALALQLNDPKWRPRREKKLDVEHGKAELNREAEFRLVGVGNMKKVQVVREVRNDLFAYEATLNGAIAESTAYLSRLEASRAELGLTGTVGDAAIARAKEAHESLLTAQARLVENHEELFSIAKMIDKRGDVLSFLPQKMQAEERRRA